jgi:hypothetical protein
MGNPEGTKKAFKSGRARQNSGVYLNARNCKTYLVDNRYKGIGGPWGFRAKV